MRAGARITVAVGVALAAVSVLYAAAELSSLWWVQSGTDQVGTYAAAGLRVSADCGAVTVAAAPAGTNEITVRRSSTWTLRRGSTTAVLEGSTLVVTSGCSPWAPSTAVDEDVEVLVPAATAVAVDTDGAITVRGLAGELTLHTGSHDIDSSALTAPAVTASSDAGDVTLRFLAPPREVSVTSAAGDTEIVVPRDEATYAVAVDAQAGKSSVEVRTDPASPRHLRVDARAGDVTLRYPG